MNRPLALALTLLFSTHAVAAIEVSALKLGDSVSIKPGAVVQAWAVPSGGRLRRAELKLATTLPAQVKSVLSIDPAKLIVPAGAKPVAWTTMLQDVYTAWAPTPGVELTLGQTKTPTTAEGLDSSGELPLPERSLVGRTYGDKREIGAKISVKRETFSAALMASSARSLAQEGSLAPADAAARVELTPSKGLSFGTFALVGSLDTTKKSRIGANARWKVGAADLRAEYARGTDSGVTGQGATFEAGYWVGESFEPVVRAEAFAPNLLQGTSGRALTVGANYLIRDYNLKLQAEASWLRDLTAVNGTPVIAQGAEGTAFTLGLQASL